MVALLRLPVTTVAPRGRLCSARGDESVIRERAVKLLGDIAAVFDFLLGHEDQSLLVRENQQILLDGKDPIRFADIEPVLCSSIGIATRTGHDLRQSVDVSFVPVRSMSDLGAIGNSYPGPSGHCLSMFSFAHDEMTSTW